MSERPTLNRELSINLLPERYRQQRLTGKQLFTIAAIVIAAGLLLPLYLLVSSIISQNAQLDLDLRGLSQQVQAKQDKLTTVAELQQTARDLQSVTSGQGELSAELQKITDKAAALSDISLSSIFLLNSEIELSGTANSATALLAYRDALSQEWGETVTLIPGTEINPPLTFTISITSGT